MSKIFSQPLRFAEPRIASAINTDNRTSLRFQLARGPIVNGSSKSSRNWSGAYIQPHHGNVFTDVAGIWTIPEITNPIGPSGGLPPASSIWVGLDGQRHYFNSTLPQIGTRQEFDAHGAIKYWGWYQWWMRDEPSTYTPSQIPIILTGNDTVFSIVQVQSPTKVVVAMAKLNPPVEFWSVSKDAPSSARISGATAEWVVERPSPKDAPEMLNPLPGSDPIVFKSCVARAATTFNAPIGVLQNLDGAQLIQMFEPRPNPARTIRLARATRVGLASPPRIPGRIRRTMTLRKHRTAVSRIRGTAPSR